MRRASALLMGLVLLMSAASCGPTFVPQNLRDQIDQNLTLGQALADPAAAKGQTVLWGGRIIKTLNKQQGTVIEVVQLPLDFTGRPEDQDQSQGRFIVSVKDFLDPAIYAPGREISAAGPILGVETLPLGDIKVTYGLLRGSALKLWPKRPLAVQMQTGPGAPLLFTGPPPPFWYYSPYPWW